VPPDEDIIQGANGYTNVIDSFAIQTDPKYESVTNSLLKPLEKRFARKLKNHDSNISTVNMQLDRKVHDYFAKDFDGLSASDESIEVGPK
jgi:hypothetical protein